VTKPGALLGRLRRDLGTLESYAAMIGMLVGAGIFKVTGVASEATGPGVVLGYLLLAPVILASSAAYVVFLSTSLGERPGGEYGNLLATFGERGRRLAFLCAWLKLISYLGALAYLSRALADYLFELSASLGGPAGPDALGTALAIGVLAFFLWVHLRGVRAFGRWQVAMCALLGLSILVLVVPGLFAVEARNYRPLLPNGAEGFLSALPPLFFAFAGFECLAHSAAEVRGSTQRLPGIFVRGILLTTLIFVSMSVVAFGVLSPEELAASDAPMAAVAAAYLPAGAAALVTVGGVLAVATSVNGTMIVPSRLALVLAADGLLPRWLGSVHADRGTPVPALLVTFVVPTLLLLSGQLALALNIAVFALVLVYLLNSVALLALPSRAPELLASAGVRLSRTVLRCAALLSIASLGALVVVQLVQDVRVLGSTSLIERFRGEALTCVELLLLWGALGLAAYRRRG
jgi:amino acid transporter